MQLRAVRLGRPHLLCPIDRLRSIDGFELVQDSEQVLLDGNIADEQPLTDIAIRQIRGNQAHHVRLTLGQSFDRTI